uniref:Uncharacterized protein n=1 Tax=Arundo donax TaxID=35708 RepID=A0A0A9G5J9_ARUDO
MQFGSDMLASSLQKTEPISVSRSVSS